MILKFDFEIITETSYGTNGEMKTFYYELKNLPNKYELLTMFNLTVNDKLIVKKIEQYLIDSDIWDRQMCINFYKNKKVVFNYPLNKKGMFSIEIIEPIQFLQEKHI